MIYKKFFAAQNSSQGFISHFEELFFSEDIRRRYIIKGGAGTGKSTFLKTLAARADERGHDVELYYCSSDVNSLDGVIIRDMGICALDATSPHAYDPKYVGCVDTLLDVTRFINADALSDKTDEIKALTAESARYYKSGYKSLKAAGELVNELYESAAGHINMRRALRTASRLTRRKEGRRELKIRLVSSISALGRTSLRDYVSKATKFYFIEDAFAIAPVLLKLIEQKANEKVTAFTDVLMPDRYEAVYLEESGIFVSAQKALLPEKFTKINRYGYYDEYYKSNKEKIRFEQKLISSLVKMASDSFFKAKVCHDKLEKINAPAMDFISMNKWNDEVIEEILSHGKA